MRFETKKRWSRHWGKYFITSVLVSIAIVVFRMNRIRSETSLTIGRNTPWKKIKRKWSAKLEDVILRINKCSYEEIHSDGESTSWEEKCREYIMKMH